MQEHFAVDFDELHHKWVIMCLLQIDNKVWSDALWDTQLMHLNIKVLKSEKSRPVNDIPFTDHSHHLLDLRDQ